MTKKQKIYIEYLQNEQSKYKDNIEYSKQYASECADDYSKNWWLQNAEKNEHFLYITNELLEAYKELLKA